jgi:glucan biosynthesis protein C
VGGLPLATAAVLKDGPSAPVRQHEIDRLRIRAMFAVFLFHCSQFFNDWGWHVKNLPQTREVAAFSLLLVQWIMPLFFVLSGVSAGYSLNQRNAGSFFKERAARLLLPWALAVVLLSPPQIYVERVTQQGFSGSFLQWLPHYLDGWYGFGGNFAWMGLHLWYCLLLFIFTALTYPLFRWLKDRPVLDGLMRSPVGPLLLAVVPMLLEFLLNPNGAGTQAMGGWNPFSYLTCFIYGFLFFRHDGFKQGLRKVGAWALGGAIITQVALTIGMAFGLQPPFGMTAPYALFAALRAGNSFLWVLGLFYLADRFMRAETPNLGYWNRALMPFYVLHQPVIVLLGFAVRSRSWALPLKMAVVVGGTFLIIMALYQWVVRSVRWLHPLFGMK